MRIVTGHSHSRFSRAHIYVYRVYHTVLISHLSMAWWLQQPRQNTVYPKKYAHGFVVLCFVVVTQSFIMISHEVFIHIHQGCFAGTGAIVRLPQCQRSKPGGYGKISQCITTTKHSKAKTVCIFLGIYCTMAFRSCLAWNSYQWQCKLYSFTKINIYRANLSVN